MTERTFFVLMNEPGEQPVVVAQNGLENWLWAVARDRSRGGDESAAAKAWRWDDAGVLDELTIRGTRVTGRREYVAEDAGGTVYARVSADINDDV
jgi:hypothetical protein